MALVRQSDWTNITHPSSKAANSMDKKNDGSKKNSDQRSTNTWEDEEQNKRKLSYSGLYIRCMIAGAIPAILIGGIVLTVVVTLWVTSPQQKSTGTTSAMNTLAPTGQTTNTSYATELPTGTILLYGGNIYALPDQNSRWLLCNGSAVSRTTYATLFSVIGTSYGVGDGTSTFNLPDFRGRFPFGSNLTNDTTLASGGNSTKTLTISTLPAHMHDQGTLQTMTAGVHVHTLVDPGHNHGGVTDYVSYASVPGYGIAWTGAAGLGWTAHVHTISADVTGITMQSNGDHTHTISGSTGTTGQGQSIDIVPPYQTVHYIIHV